MTVSLRSARTLDEIETARTLLREYAGYLNHSLGEEHICLDSYERELAELPGAYVAPDGMILLAFVAEGNEEMPAGCVALKRLLSDRLVDRSETACEMKRLWVRPQFRGQSLGLALVEELIAYARHKGYAAMYLDTVPGAMQSAAGIYRKLGFEQVGRYNMNPILGINPAVAVEFFRLQL
jgi:putative acetyltransferase